MSDSLEKFKLEEKIYLSCAKHRGNVDMVAKELNLPYDFAYKICTKIKHRQDRDVNMLICGHIMGAIMIGRESRIQYYTTMINALEGRDSVEVSTCCKSILVPKIGTQDIVCLACQKPSSTFIMHQGEVYRTRMELLGELRKEDTALVAFAEKMGYTQKQDAGMVYKDQRKYLVIGGNTNQQQQQNNNFDALPEKQQLLLNDAAKLSPIERTNLINSIQAEVLAEHKKGESTDESPT